MDPTPVDHDTVPFPVDAGVAIETTAINLEDWHLPLVRDVDGELLSSVGRGESQSISPGDCYVELSTPVKTYLRIPEGFDCTVDPDSKEGVGTQFRLDAHSRVEVYARPWRVGPTREIVVGPEPEDLLDALSYFGGALHTHSPERSFPTLRGHPPAIRVGDALDVPEDLSRPDAGVTIEVPSTLSAAYAVAPLAHYLAADVVPGEEFAVRTDEGFTCAPETQDETIYGVARDVLRRCLTFDCLLRIEGLYPIDLQERLDFEARSDVEALDLDFAALYDASLAERTATALRVSREAIEAVAPRWSIAAVVEPGVAATEALPYLVDRLATIRTADPPRYAGDEARIHVARSFASSGGDDTRSASLVFDNRETFVDVPDTDADRAIWVGDGVPLDAAKFLREGYEHRARRADELVDTTLEIDVVSAEVEMDEELEAVTDSWDFRSDREVDVSVHERPSTTALRELIEDGTDFLHFVGHADADGLVCAEQRLDVATVEESRVDAFCLNACESYRQGQLLVERGSVGGIVTHVDVSNAVALGIGGTIARLLNAGFPLGTARELLKTSTNSAGQYAVVGDESVCLVDPNGSVPYLQRLQSLETGAAYRLQLQSFAASALRFGVGAMQTYGVGPANRRYLVPGTAGPFELTETELDEVSSRDNAPSLVDGELRWDL